MKRWILGAGVLAVTGAAPGASWDLAIDPNYIVGPGDFVTVSIYASFDESDYAFAGAEFSITADDAFGRFYDLEEQLGGPGAFAGIADGPMVTGIVTGQLHSPGDGLFADTSNPILVWTGKFTVNEYFYRGISVKTVTSLFDVYADPDGTRGSRLDGFQEGVGGVIVCACPEPGAGTIGIVGACGVACRRRR